MKITYYDIAFRAANKFSDKFAAKFTVSYVEGEDWHAVDYRDINRLGRGRSYNTNNAGVTAPWRNQSGLDSTPPTDPSMYPDYDGVNVYGDLAQRHKHGSSFCWSWFYLDLYSKVY